MFGGLWPLPLSLRGCNCGTTPSPRLSKPHQEKNVWHAGMRLEQAFWSTNCDSKDCLILRSKSLLLGTESLIARNNSLFAIVGNLPLSLWSAQQKSGAKLQNRQFVAKIPCKIA